MEASAYSSAVIRVIGFGLRRELRLELEVARPLHRTATDGSNRHHVAVRFGSIASYEEVCEAFNSIPLHAELHYLQEAADSKPTRRLIDLDIDRTEQRPRIVAAHVDEDASL